MSPPEIKQTKELLERMSKEQLVSLLLWREQQLEKLNAMLEAVGAGGVPSTAKPVCECKRTTQAVIDAEREV